MITEIGFIIQPGESIPDDVIGVRDVNRYLWEHRPTGWWGPRAQSLPGDLLVGKFAPLTVTAVRQQPTDEPDEDLVHYRLPGATLTFCGLDPWDDEVSITERAGSSNCRACRLTADEAEPPVVSPLLDLVRQYGSQRHMNGLNLGGALPDTQGHKAAAAALLDRIAALVAQQPVQARDGDDEPLWIHACGKVVGWKPSDPPAWACDNDTGPWRPLLVGGDPAPKAEDSLMQALGVESPEEVRPAIEEWKARAHKWESIGARVMAELGVDRPDELLRTVKYFQSSGYLGLARERDEARAEVERLRVEHRSGDGCSHFGRLLEVLGAENLREALAEIERLKAAQSDPLVLSLPTGSPRIFEVPIAPEGITRVSDSQDEVWTLDSDDGMWHCDVQGWSPLPWHLLLADHGRLVEVAPPREPRTWPQLDPEWEPNLPVHAKVDGYDGVWLRLGPDDCFVQPGSQPRTLAGLRVLGDVTEVFDEPGGAR